MDITIEESQFKKLIKRSYLMDFICFVGVIAGVIGTTLSYKIYLKTFDIKEDMSKITEMITDYLDDRSVIYDFIDAVKSKDCGNIRVYNEGDFATESKLIDCDKLFNTPLHNIIINSDPLEDWDFVGWRGIALNDGDVWIERDGTLRDVYYVTRKEQHEIDSRVKKDRAMVHKSLKKFNTNTLKMNTMQYLIRIDEVGSDVYRYAAWDIEKSMSDKPDIVINNGEYIWQGSGGNHSYQFKQGDYLYTVYVSILGTGQESQYLLTISKDSKIVLQQYGYDIED